MRVMILIIYLVAMISCSKEKQEREILQKVERYDTKVFYPDTILWQTPHKFAFINLGVTNDYIEAVYFVDRMKIHFDGLLEVQHLSNYPVEYRIELLENGFNIVDDNTGEVAKYR